MFFQFLELRHKTEIYNLTGRVVECPLDEMNRPRAAVDPQLRVPPAEAEIERLFAGWREELATCRKFAPAARNYAAARLEADVGLRVNEARDAGPGRRAVGAGPVRQAERPPRQGLAAARAEAAAGAADQRRGPDLRWFIEDVWGQFDDDHARPGAPLFPSERKCRWLLLRGRPPTCSAGRWPRPPPAPARLGGQADPACPAPLLRLPALPRGDEPVRYPGATGHAWTGTTARYIHVHATHVEDAWVAGQQRAADRWKGLAR